jgi:hypothetical protein
MLLIMRTASEDSTALLFTILFTGIAGITILMFMILITHGIHLHGQCRGTGDGDTVGTHLIPITVMDTVIHLITATGTGLITDGVILTTVHGMVMEVVIMEVITTVAGMPILKITVMEEGLQVRPMYDTETEQAGI